MKNFSFGPLLSFLLLLASPYTLSCHHCVHDKMKTEIQRVDFSPYQPNENRMLTSYQSIRLYFDYSNFNVSDQSLRDYIINELITPSQNYIQSAIKVPASTGNFTLDSFTSICSSTISVPEVYRTSGVEADTVLFVTATTDTAQSYLAYTLICVLENSTSRPVAGQLNFNIAKIKTTSSIADREGDITTTIHEITHMLGFSVNTFSLYRDPTTGATLTGHIFNKTVNGMTVSVLNLPSLTARLKTYFNCSTLDGAYMENEGSTGSIGSHFERRVFYNEFMTASRINDNRISEFTLAVLEGSGWYQVDYTKAEPMTWGKGKGCTFLDGPCMDTATLAPKFSEFCSPLLSRVCSYTWRKATICGTSEIKTGTVSSGINWWSNNTKSEDQFSDNCPVYVEFTNTDCEDPSNLVSVRIPQSSSGYGSKCFMGTLSNTDTPKSYGFYCFTPTCEAQADGSYVLKVLIGSATVSCTAAGSISVPGVTGTLTCPDPNAFCNIIEGEGYCRRKCTGRGTCSSKVCQCQAGWGSYDCGLRNDNCDRCKNGDPMKTSCFGDICACNPADTKCNPTSDSTNIGLIVGLVAGGVAILSGLTVAFWFRKSLAAKFKRRKTTPQSSSPKEGSKEAQSISAPQEQQDMAWPPVETSTANKLVNLNAKDNSISPASVHGKNEYNVIPSPWNEIITADVEKTGR